MTTFNFPLIQVQFLREKCSEHLRKLAEIIDKKNEFTFALVGAQLIIKCKDDDSIQTFEKFVRKQLAETSTVIFDIRGDFREKLRMISLNFPECVFRIKKNPDDENEQDIYECTVMGRVDIHKLCISEIVKEMWDSGQQSEQEIIPSQNEIVQDNQDNVQQQIKEKKKRRKPKKKPSVNLDDNSAEQVHPSTLPSASKPSTKPSNRHIIILDTNIFLLPQETCRLNTLLKNHKVVIGIPQSVITELEKKKKLQSPLGASARSALKALDARPKGTLMTQTYEALEKKEYAYQLQHDDFIVQWAHLLSETEKQEVWMVSDDRGLRLRARSYEDQIRVFDSLTELFKAFIDCWRICAHSYNFLQQLPQSII